MRVAVVTLETIHHRETDTTRRLRDHVRRLDARGHDVTVCCAQWWDGGHDHWADEQGISYQSIGERPTASRAHLWRVPSVLRNLSPDVVHANAHPPLVAAAASIARAPLLVEWYGTEPLPTGWWRRRLFSRADALVTPSRLCKRRLRECGADAEKIEVIPDAVDFERIRDTAPDDGEHHIVYARRLDEGANVESLLLGLAELRTKDWSATIIGDGPQRAAYEEQARDLRIRDRLTFAGECSRDRRIAIYRNAHVFVQTARQCPFATELLWALACGCVGIVEYHAESSAHELVEGRTRGFRTTSEQELADAIRSAGDLDRLDVDPDFASFDADDVLETYIDCYKRLRGTYGVLN